VKIETDRHTPFCGSPDRLLTRALPGDPAAYFAGPAATQQAIEEIRHTLGFDRSLPVQFVDYLKALGRGDLGNSLGTGQPVAEELLTRLPASAELTLLGLLLAVAIAVPLGIAAANRPGAWIDHLCRIVATAGVSLPVFFTGLLLVYVFYYLSGWAPAPLGRLDVYFSAPTRRTGFYLVDSLLAGDVTAFRAIADPLRRLRRLAGTALRARVEEVARLTGLPGELLGRFPHQLSGGQKARVGIARAIAVEPRLLILDEPTSALDVSVQVVILKLLDELKRRLGLSYLFVSHDLNVVRLLCDRILVMYLGHIVESGPADEIFAAPAHPYTKALLSAVPSIGVAGGVGATGRQRIELPGDPRSPIDPDPKICPLYGRCFQATNDCTTTMPALREIAPGRRAACHFPIVDAPIVDATARAIARSEPAAAVALPG
jgi:oligopeptide/dipeptide ABC transporter ATP-binding protein